MTRVRHAGVSRRPEIEIKLQIRESRAVRRHLRKLGFRRVQARHFESNAMFDFPDLRLWKTHRLLRLREAGGEWTLTFKDVPTRTRRYKVRREIEVELDDGARLREIFARLGLAETFRYEKFRTIYAPQDWQGGGAPLVAYDETPIGEYLELEGPPRWIDEVGRKLGYRESDFITASYGSLYRRWCQARGQKPGNMVFSS